MEPNTQATPWLRLPAKAGAGGATESGRNYEAFECYFQQPVGTRSLARVAQQLKKSVRLIEKWSSRFDWLARADARDREQSRLVDEERVKVAQQEAAKWEQRKRRHRERNHQMGEKLIKKADQMLDLPLTTMVVKDGKMIIQPGKFKVADAATLFRVGREAIERAVDEAAPETDLRNETWEVEDYRPRANQDE